jgi:hypothetical protein
VTKLLLTIHVLAVILSIGPVAVAASMFPAVARRGGPTDLLHRICRVYAGVAVVVPVFGIATATSLHVLGSAWLLTAIALTVLAAGTLALLILPGQAAVLRGETTRTLPVWTGVFNLLWTAVTILMIVRPGSTTGA